MITVLEMLFTKEAENDLRAAAAAGNRTIISLTNLPCGEAFVVMSRHATWQHEDFYVPASHHQTQDLLFTKDDPGSTGRPVRFRMYNHPKDGDSMIGWEFAGYKRLRPNGKVLGYFVEVRCWKQKRDFRLLLSRLMPALTRSVL
jgi:hypothetical protein